MTNDPQADQRVTVTRCGWAGPSREYVDYHDQEWGVPCHDDRRLFEFVILEGAQAGLSWSTILAKRDNYRRLFCGFDPVKVAKLGPARRERLLQDPGIIRNRLKVESAVSNAKVFLNVADEFGCFSDFIWGFVDHEPIRNRWRSLKQIPAQTPESLAMSKELKKRGFSFVGPTICYAFMQSVGMVNDHLVSCFRYKQVVAEAGRR